MDSEVIDEVLRGASTLAEGVGANGRSLGLAALVPIKSKWTGQVLRIVVRSVREGTRAGVGKSPSRAVS